MDSLRSGEDRSRNEPSRPGGNVTGVTQLNVEASPKRLELAHVLMPSATAMARSINPTIRVPNCRQGRPSWGFDPDEGARPEASALDIRLTFSSPAAYLLR